MSETDTVTAFLGDADLGTSRKLLGVGEEGHR
jgi:hypothetical protein